MSTRSCIHHHLTDSKSVRRRLSRRVRPMRTAVSMEWHVESQLAPTAIVASEIRSLCAESRSCCTAPPLLALPQSVCAVRLTARAVVQLTFVRDEAEDMIQTSLRKRAVRWASTGACCGVLASSPVHNGVAGWSHTAPLL